MHNIKPIQKVKVSDEVFDQMKRNIITGAWAPGTRLSSETKLAETFHVSRVSVRAAIHRLAAIGLLDTRNGEGTFVVDVKAGMLLTPLMQDLTLKPANILELLEFRQAVEMLSMRLAAERATEQQILELERIVDRMRDCYEKKDTGRYSVEDMKFHSFIADMSGNSMIQKVLTILQEFMLTHLVEMNDHIGLDLGFGYHIKMFNAIKNRDGKEAEKQLYDNIRASIDEVKKRGL